jgi:hypothetical protein
VVVGEILTITPTEASAHAKFLRPAHTIMVVGLWIKAARILTDHDMPPMDVSLLFGMRGPYRT